MNRSNAAIRIGIALALALALVSCATLPRPDDSTRCGPPSFPYSQGWLGGDAAYSVPLAADTTLWLFGDSFVNALAPATPAAPATPSGRPPTRRGATLVHNSIGVATCSDAGHWNIDYAWGKGESGEPEAFLDPGVPGRYWWLFDGFVHADALYLGLLIVEESEPRGALNLPFRFTGVQLARIRHFRRAPERWEIEILPLSAHPQAFPTSSLVVDGDYLYLFAFVDSDTDQLPQILTRIPLSALESDRPGDRLEYWARSGHWRAGIDTSDAMQLMEDTAAEITVRFHPELERWLAIYNHASTNPKTGDPSAAVYLRSAARLDGPWSEPTPVFEIPELADDSAGQRDPNTACYAAKEHPHLAGEGRLLITYVCNLFTKEGEDPFAVLGRLLDQMNLYRPVAVSLPLPELHKLQR